MSIIPFIRGQRRRSYLRASVRSGPNAVVASNRTNQERGSTVRGTIVVYTDGSETSRQGIICAGTLALASQRKVVVVFVYANTLSAAAGVDVPSAIVTLQEALGYQAVLAQGQAIVCLEPLGVQWSFEARCGDIASELMDVATRHAGETIVVAGARKGALSNLARRSVPAKLLHRWPHTLLVMHPTPDAD
ncbi:MAG TPA: universal stress protein [Acidimicrobiales bacterium]|jgi:nucleotide-binding universal stress UspA family protein|nr:universal stress protein [Acidimicrobiales bacterium]